MPGRTPHEAIQNFLEPLTSAVACVGTTHVTLQPKAYDVGESRSWVLNDGIRPVQMSGEHDLWLAARMVYEIADRGRSERDQRFKVRTVAYLYSIGVEGGKEVLAAHWHPQGNSEVDFPHHHLEGPLIDDGGVFSKRAHVPSGRISFEWVVRFAIEHMGVEPQVEDWSER